MDSPRPTLARIWMSFGAGVLVGAIMTTIAVLVLVAAEGDLTAPFTNAPARPYSLVPPGWIPFAFAVVFALGSWAFSGFALRASLSERAGALASQD